MMSRAPGREGEERFLLDSTRKSDGCPYDICHRGGDIRRELWHK